MFNQKLLQITKILALFNQKSRNPKFCNFTIETLTLIGTETLDYLAYQG